MKAFPPHLRPAFLLSVVLLTTVASAPVGVVVPCVAAEETSPAPPPFAEPAVSFERDVHPIFKAYCTHCHGEEDDVRGGLDLRLRRSAVGGGDSGAAVLPGNAHESLILQRILDGDMPPAELTKRPTAAEIATLKRWINRGARTAGREPQQLGRGMLITANDRNWWAFQPVDRPPVPQVQQANRVRNPIDAFVLAQLERNQFTLAKSADRRTLIRRATWDLWGLPPTPAEVAAFEHDTSPRAWENLIERLLESPHYGERWGRHWLDVAGYADSEGVNEADTQRKWAWKYRDYVIRSFNADKPYDQFLQEQLAGDELNALARNESSSPTPDSPSGSAALSPQEIDRLIATGFLRMAPDGTAAANTDQGVARNQTIADTLQIVAGSVLALTVECAQCHEHRYDPIPQADYYRFRAIFEPAFDWKNWRKPAQRLVSMETAADRQASARLEAEAVVIDKQRLKREAELIAAVVDREIAKLPEDIRDSARTARDTAVKKRSPEQIALLKKHPSLNVSAGSLYLYDKAAADELKKIAAKASAIRKRKPKPEFVRALTERTGQLPITQLFHRGDHEQPKDTLSPAELTILQQPPERAEIDENDNRIPTSGRRLTYAQQLTDGTHPLTARVLVNRVWRHHFGRGLVNTPGDFGRLGDKPSHPQLLDWLADEFVANGWSLKQLHRLIMTSATYQQGLRSDLRLIQTDPDNTLFGGARLRRLPAESVRDGMLRVSGLLNPKSFGPPIPVMADKVGQWVIGIENLNAGRPGAVIPMKGEEFRRSVYVEVRRSRPLSMLETFDSPRMEPHCQARTASTVAPQALTLLNGEFVLQQSQALAERIFKDTAVQETSSAIAEKPGAATNPVPARSAARLQQLWQRVFSRDPTSEELKQAHAFLVAQLEELVPRLKQDKQLKGKPPEQIAFASLCQMLLGSNEFLYVD